MRPSLTACSPPMRPRSSRFATSEVMKTVLPACDSPVTPQAQRIVERATGNRMADLGGGFLHAP